MNDILSKNEIESLYVESLKNAYSLWTVATKNLESEYKYVSLGLSEIALEEIGKSYMLLTLYSDDEAKWDVFWKCWKNHNMKATYAYYYEWFSPFRIEIEGITYKVREEFAYEKEVSFYVDFDHKKRIPITPEKNITFEEIMYRGMSITGLINTAMNVKDAFMEGTNDYKKAFSDYARVIPVKKILQKDVLKVLELMKNSNNDYDEALEDIKTIFTTKIKIPNIN